MEIIRKTFCKKERLTGQKEIGHLFEKGQQFLVYPVKVVWFESETALPFPARAAFTASKKNFRRAVCRNLLKRRMKEAYRLQKNSFYTSLENKKLSIMFIYIAREILDYQLIEKSMHTALSRLAKIK